MKYCPKPCGGRQPCIRTCMCGRGMMSNDEGGCTKMSEEVKKQLRAHDNSKFIVNYYLRR